MQIKNIKLDILEVINHLIVTCMFNRSNIIGCCVAYQQRRCNNINNTFYICSFKTNTQNHLKGFRDLKMGKESSMEVLWERVPEASRISWN